MQDEDDFLSEVADEVARSGTSFGNDQQSSAQVFTMTFGHEVRWVQPERTWYVCSREPGARYWSPETTEGVTARMLSAATYLSAHEKPSIRRQMRSSTFVRGSLDLAKSGVAVKPSAFNGDPLLLGCRNGVVELTTGKLRDVVPEDMLSKRCAVAFDPAAECPRWMDHLRVLTRQEVAFDAPGDPELMDYLQELVGLSLIGEQREHQFIFLHGMGRNGKGIFADTVRETLGDYGDLLDQMVLFQDGGAHTTGLVDLRSMRFVTTDELEARREVNTGLLKKLTGGGELKARKMRQDNVRFPMTWSLWLVSNFEPNFGLDSSEGLWSRAIIVVTGPSLRDEDKRPDADVRAELRGEGSGILRWAVEGGVRYLGRGGRMPPKPKRVQEATESVAGQARLMRKFLDERASQKEDGATPLKDVRAQFEYWLEFNEGVRPKPGKDLTSAFVKQLLQQEGYRVDRGTGNRVTVFGLDLTSEVFGSKAPAGV